MPGPWPSDPCLPETPGTPQLQNGKDSCPSLPPGLSAVSRGGSPPLHTPLCHTPPLHTHLLVSAHCPQALSCLACRLLCTHTSFGLAPSLPPTSLSLIRFFDCLLLFFRPASQVPRPASYLSLHCNWEISKSVISLNTRMPIQVTRARPASWASDTSTRPPLAPLSSARQNWAEPFSPPPPSVGSPSFSVSLYVLQGRVATTTVTLGSLFLPPFLPSLQPPSAQQPSPFRC